jgi:peroxiredoxin Q/BCP
MKFMISPGQPFPSFSLPDQDGTTVTNEDLKGSETIVYFYPKDDTPGCTIEACEFQSAVADMKRSGTKAVRVVGVSPDSPRSHRKFADKFGLEFTLLADENHALAEEFGFWVEKSMYGKKYMGVERSTVVLDPNGIVVSILQKVKPEGHAAEVLSTLP